MYNDYMCIVIYRLFLVKGENDMTEENIRSLY